MKCPSCGSEQIEIMCQTWVNGTKHRLATCLECQRRWHCGKHDDSTPIASPIKKFSLDIIKRTKQKPRNRIYLEGTVDGDRWVPLFKTSFYGPFRRYNVACFQMFYPLYKKVRLKVRRKILAEFEVWRLDTVDIVIRQRWVKKRSK